MSTPTGGRSGTIERTIRTTSRRGIKNAFDLVGIARLRCHHHPEAPKLEVFHQSTSNDRTC